MNTNDRINRRLAPFGLAAKDLSASELKEARAALKGGKTGGFFSSETLISKSLRKK